MRSMKRWPSVHQLDCLGCKVAPDTSHYWKTNQAALVGTDRMIPDETNFLEIIDVAFDAPYRIDAPKSKHLHANHQICRQGPHLLLLTIG